jgi:hypothetical protein
MNYTRVWICFTFQSATRCMKWPPHELRNRNKKFWYKTVKGETSYLQSTAKNLKQLSQLETNDFEHN